VTAIYFLAGVVFGFIITKAEVISWFRIQEMFRFQGFHMYGVFATAVPTAMLGVQWLKRGTRTIEGAPVVVAGKELGTGVRYAAGGLIFGIGWAFMGACPGPLFALFGSGIGVVGATIVSALIGNWAYAVLRPRLPH
jgi:uncharacterized membrane protein YedE/YeeE